LRSYKPQVLESGINSKYDAMSQNSFTAQANSKQSAFASGASDTVASGDVDGSFVWDKVDLQSGVEGILPVTCGGTSKSTASAGSVVLGNGTGALEYRPITDTSSAYMVGSSTNFLTERSAYYGFPTINGSKSYSYSSDYYLPTSSGLSGQYIYSTGSSIPIFSYGQTGSYSVYVNSGYYLNYYYFCKQTSNIFTLDIAVRTTGSSITKDNSYIFGYISSNIPSYKVEAPAWTNTDGYVGYYSAAAWLETNGDLGFWPYRNISYKSTGMVHMHFTYTT
jgi:hypothetical protein